MNVLVTLHYEDSNSEALILNLNKMKELGHHLETFATHMVDAFEIKDFEIEAPFQWIHAVWDAKEDIEVPFPATVHNRIEVFVG